MENSNRAKKLLFGILAAAYCLILPFIALEIILELYLTFSSLNLALTFLGLLAHIDLTVYLLYRHFSKGRDKQ